MTLIQDFPLSTSFWIKIEQDHRTHASLSETDIGVVFPMEISNAGLSSLCRQVTSKMARKHDNTGKCQVFINITGPRDSLQMSKRFSKVRSFRLKAKNSLVSPVLSALCFLVYTQWEKIIYRDTRTLMNTLMNMLTCNFRRKHALKKHNRHLFCRWDLYSSAQLAVTPVCLAINI